MVQIPHALAFFVLVFAVRALPTEAESESRIQGVRLVNYLDKSATGVSCCTNPSPSSAGVANPRPKAARSAAILAPGTSIYIQNIDGKYLTRYGEDGLLFAKTAPDQYCKFKVRSIEGCAGNYVSLVADNNLPITLYYGSDPPTLQLYRLYPTCAFDQTAADEGLVGGLLDGLLGGSSYYLGFRDLSRLDRGPWTVAGANSDGSHTIQTSTDPRAVYIIDSSNMVV
ncbi:hypothetical protein C8R47DRAFT_1215023 [Mycena vitilis]|nr:hypothetical protein C8R47DRAFT_1215023 [Mycena vitilis]